MVSIFVEGKLVIVPTFDRGKLSMVSILEEGVLTTGSVLVGSDRGSTTLICRLFAKLDTDSCTTIFPPGETIVPGTEVGSVFLTSIFSIFNVIGGPTACWITILLLQKLVEDIGREERGRVRVLLDNALLSILITLGAAFVLGATFTLGIDFPFGIDFILDILWGTGAGQ